MAACPAGAITSFPLGIMMTPTQALYEGQNDNSLQGVSVQWNPRTTPPSFQNANGTSGVLNEDSDKTTLRYNSVKYPLLSAQICGATHTEWIIPAGTENLADLVLIFENMSANTTVSNVIIVIPLISGSNPSDPAYLQGLTDETMSGNFSLKDCMPSDDSMYIHYVSCLEGYVQGSNVSNAAVFVNVFGKRVSQDLLTKIKSKLGPQFPVKQAPFLSSFKGTMKIGTASETSYTLDKYITTTTKLFTIPTSGSSRIDKTDKYKCVPLDPDANIVDGAIQVNTDTGEILTNVLKDRSAAKTPDSGAGLFGMTVDRAGAEAVLSTILAVLGLVLLGLCAWQGGLWMKGFFTNPITPVATGAAPGPVTGTAVTVTPWHVRLWTALKYPLIALIILSILGFIAALGIIYMFVRASRAAST